METTKQRLYQILDIATNEDRLSRTVDLALLILILLNGLAVILETVEELHAAYQGAFLAFEYVSVAIFAVEYSLRLWTCTADPRYAGSISGRLRFATSPLAVIDLLAILPIFLPMFLPIDLRVGRLVRLVRLFRLLKLTRYVESVGHLARVFRAKRDELSVSMLMVGLILVLASTAMYAVEHAAQPEAFSSIPAAMWWGVATLTTVGYGDIYPITPIGKLLGSGIALLGVGMVALPAGILASGFADEMRSHPDKQTTCPHCGKEL